MIWLLPGLVAFVLASLIVLAIRSRRSPPLGLVDGRLRSCPPVSNCVCTETGDFPPLPVTGSVAGAWERAKQIVRAMGGVVDREEAGYLHATFTTRVFRFVDDLELRLDEPARVIHIRSAARVGQRDLGVNRRRVEELRRRYASAAPRED
jgi:uncharacterized protein (DUF1499 family)